MNPIWRRDEENEDLEYEEASKSLDETTYWCIAPQIKISLTSISHLIAAATLVSTSILGGSAREDERCRMQEIYQLICWGCICR